MRALVCHALSPDLSGLRFEPDWMEPLPPRPGEVSVSLHTVGLNFPDLLMLRGGYQFRPLLPFIPGTEGCGMVIAAGQGCSDLLGQRVMVGARQGLLAERATVPGAAVRPVPTALNDVEAAGFTVGALTAWVGLVERGRMQLGDDVLIAGAGGGMGLAAVALAALEGAHVTAVASSPEKLRMARLAGAQAVIQIDRNEPRIAASHIDLVFDPVGGALTMPAMGTLARGGRYAIIGFTGGQAPRFAFDYAQRREIEIIGVRAGEQGRQDPASGAAALAEIDARAGALKPQIGMVAPLRAAADAFAAMAGGILAGKAVIMVEPARR